MIGTRCQYPSPRAMLFAALALSAASAAAQQPCNNLRTLSLDNARISSATEVSPAPEWHVPRSVFSDGGYGPNAVMVSFCRVSGVIETEIQFEVWLPLQEWNGNLQVVGNGGVTGDFNYPSMAAAIARGYATATSDLGHRAGSFQDASWAPGHPERVANYADRAHHLLAQQAKKVTSAFYGR